MKVIGLRFKNKGKIYDFRQGDFDIKIGDKVIVDTAQGTEVGEVVYIDKEVKKGTKSIKPILRIAGLQDLKKITEQERQKPKAIDVCNEFIKKHKLPMKVIDCEFNFGGDKLTFFFASETRVDFRELVKDLAHHFKKQIRLIQIGPRDEVKLFGGYGHCGLPLCCNQFLEDLESVSMDMARVQDMAQRGAAKISGVCGRLMCCLAYESRQYEDLGKNFPQRGDRVTTLKGKGEVIERNILKQTVKVNLEDEVIIEVPISEIKMSRKKQKD